MQSQGKSNTVQTGAEKRVPFDQYLERLPASKQSTHRWLGWLVIAATVLTLGVFIYAIYTSIIWKSAGGENVIRG